MKPSKASKPSRPSGSPRRSALLVVALGAASLALGLDALVARAAPILHEYVPPPGKGDTGRWAREGRLPDHIRVEDRLLPKPRERGTADKGERVLGGRRASSKMDRATTVGPDRKTTHDGVLRYTAEFNPSVVPFKRMTALDSVTAEFRLAVRDSTPQLVPLAKRPTPPDRDPFWGSLVLEAKAGKLMAIPSVAPGAAIVSYRTSSADGRAKSATVSFYRDSADNMSIRTNVSGQLRVVFLTDAPRSYFSPEIPPLITIAQVPPSLRPLVPANVRSAANKVLAHIGVTSSQTMRRQLERLVAYFRNFEAKQLERRSGNTYLDIALSQRGVCRHRSYAFVITAQTAGIPARYVHNEAHAFAEAWVPRLGWLRIDLGGASSELRVGNAQRKAVHNAGPDPFPRPSRYAGNYSQLRGNVTGLRSNQRIRRTGTNLRSFDRSRRAAAGATGGGQLGPSVGGGIGGGAARGSGGSSSPAAGAASAAAGAANGSAAGADSPRAGPAPPAAPTRVPTRVSVTVAKNAARRGQRLRVWGKVENFDGLGVANLRVEIYLSRDGRAAQALLGAAITDKGGGYDVELPIPRNIVVGRYKVFAATPGDQRHEASLSE